MQEQGKGQGYYNLDETKRYRELIQEGDGISDRPFRPRSGVNIVDFLRGVLPLARQRAQAALQSETAGPEEQRSFFEFSGEEFALRFNERGEPVVSHATPR